MNTHIHMIPMRSIPRCHIRLPVRPTVRHVMPRVMSCPAGVLVGLMPVAALWWCALAAFLANNVESLLGASLQNDKHPWATNEVGR